MTCFFSLPIFKYNSAHSRTRIFTFFYFISLHSRQLPTPHPFLSRQLNRHCSRVVVVVLGISLLYISSIHSALAALLFLPSRQSTKRKQQYSPVGVALTFHLFFLLLFFLFLLCSAHVTSGPDGGLVLEKLPQFGPFFKISFPPHISSFFLNIG